MYEACMDVKTLEERGLEPVMNMLDEIGLPHFPTIINATGDNTFSCVTKFGEFAMIMTYNETDETESYETREYTVHQIQNITDSVQALTNGTTIPIWKRYFEGIFTVKDEKLDFEKEKISINQLDLEYLCLMAAYVSKTPPIHLELYIWMKVIEVLAADTTQTLYQLFLKIYPTDIVAARSLRCANAVNDMLGMAVAYAIAEPDFINVVKPEIQVMLKNLKGALAQLIGKTKWMDDNTKLKSYRKIIEMKTLIGFPDWLLQEGQLESYYKGIEVNKKTHLENMISIAQIEIKAKMDDYRQPRPNLWYIDPTVVNAYHVFATNTISRLYDKDGYSKNWWSNETVDSYQNMTECLIKQYSSFKIPELGKNIDGHKTLGENIADNGAIRQAFAAFERHLRRTGPEAKLPGFEEYSPQQMFFMSYGNLWCGVSTNNSLKASLEDEHSPLKFRVKGSLQNIEQFSRTWNCPPESPMNPTKKCVIF
ncbi:Endothelin-converting enzyme 2 [Papilio machaon]|uniref:Endothelin-converting enzyme 2 n=1 Tax=Papilio machaon TaxID=76193 RepID=A0A0N0PCT9_PAPMA|nr:Endothelin-converting enzyme 2 [Papilio machaon]